MASRDPLNPYFFFILETYKTTPDHADTSYLQLYPLTTWGICAMEQRKKHQITTPDDLAESIQELDESLEGLLPNLFRTIKKKNFMRFVLETCEKEYLMIDFQRGLPKDIKQYLAFVEMNKYEIMMTKFF